MGTGCGGAHQGKGHIRQGAIPADHQEQVNLPGNQVGSQRHRLLAAWLAPAITNDQARIVVKSGRACFARAGENGGPLEAAGSQPGDFSVVRETLTGFGIDDDADGFGWLHGSPFGVTAQGDRARAGMHAQHRRNDGDEQLFRRILSLHPLRQGLGFRQGVVVQHGEVQRPGGLDVFEEFFVQVLQGGLSRARGKEAPTVPVSGRT